MGLYGSPKLEPVKNQLSDENYEKTEMLQKNKKLKNCKTCNHLIAKSSKKCPNCGAKNKKPVFGRILFWVLLITVLLLIAIPKNTPESTKAKTMSADEYKEYCKLIAYSDLARKPDEYLNLDVKSGGVILQIMDNAEEQTLRIQANGDMDDVFAVTLKKEGQTEKFLENDIVNFYGSFIGIEHYKTIFGKEISVPAINASYVSKTTSDLVLSDKPTYTFKVNEVAAYEGIELTVKDIKTSKGSGYNKPDKGNVFYIIAIVLENKSAEKITYSPNDFKILNENGQINGNSWIIPEDVNQLDSGELTPNGKVEGQIIFQESINSSKLTLLYFKSILDTQPTFRMNIK